MEAGINLRSGLRRLTPPVFPSDPPKLAVCRSHVRQIYESGSQEHHRFDPMDCKPWGCGVFLTLHASEHPRMWLSRRIHYAVLTPAADQQHEAEDDQQDRDA